MPRSTTVTPISEARAKSKPKRNARSVSANALAVRKPQMEEMLNVGPTKGQQLINSGAVESILIGRTRLITVRSIHALIEGKMA